MSSSLLMVVGLISVVIIFSLIFAAFQPVMGSVANDAAANNVTNDTTVQTGNSVAVGFMGFDAAIIFAVIILLIVACAVLMFVL